jgi:hypothetical protein
MSLDVYLTMEGKQYVESGSGIFVRENGETKEISRIEWDGKFPGREPVIVEPDATSSEVYSANITHNLSKMADAAGIYECLWRPEEVGITKASQLIEPLTKGLEFLKSDPDRFEKFNSPNGWGLYNNFVPWVERYLEACTEYPDAKVSVSR